MVYFLLPDQSTSISLLLCRQPEPHLPFTCSKMNALNVSITCEEFHQIFSMTVFLSFAVSSPGYVFLVLTIEFVTSSAGSALIYEGDDLLWASF